jgi:hypothetical protein
VSYMGGSAAYLWGLVQTWTGRANNAWGASRVWNSGSSFETDSANWQSSSSTWQSRANSAWGASRVWNSGSSFETDSANWQASSNTWQSRANSAWGASRVWNSGESWEAAYNRVLPAALWDGAIGAGTATLSGSQWRQWVELYPWNGTLTVPYTGQYAVTAWVHCTYGSHNDDPDWAQVRVVNAAGRVALSGGTLGGGPGTKRDGRNSGTWHMCDGVVQLNANTQLRSELQHDSPNAGPSTNWDNLVIRARFIPTQQYPH